MTTEKGIRVREDEVRARLRDRLDRDGGFSLIELLVVIIIIGILAAIAIPLYINQRQKARDAAVKSDLRGVAHVLETHYVDNATYPAKPALDVAGLVPRLSGKTAVIMLQHNATGYCLAGINSDGSPPPASQAGWAAKVVWWWDSSAGGLQPRDTPIVGNSGCPVTNGWSADWWQSVWISPDF